MNISSLFTPEVMERMFAVLETAAQGSAIVLCIYLAIPILAAIVSGGVTLGIVYMFCNTIKKVLTIWHPCVRVLDVKCLDSEAEVKLTSLLQRARSSVYLTKKDVERLTESYDEYEEKRRGGK